MKTLRARSLATTFAVLLTFTLGTYSLLAPLNTAHGYTFSWPTEPYLRDGFGNYSYRDMSISWWGCGSGYCWWGSASSYVNFVDPNNLYHFDSAGFLTAGSGGLAPNDWDYAGLYLTTSNTPYTWYPPNILADHFGEVDVHSAHCEGTSCAFIGIHTNYASLLYAIFPAGETTPGWDNCEFKKDPEAWNC